jgi:hypothetical protein
MKNKLSPPYFRNQQWNVDEKLDKHSVVVRNFDTRSEAEEFIEQYGDAFDPEDKDMWRNVLNCLQDDEDGQGYLFDHFKALESQIKHWLEAHRG